MGLPGNHNPFDVSQDANRLKARGNRRARRAPGTSAPLPRRDRSEKVEEERDVVVTPTEIDRRVDRMGRPYIYTRGDLKHRNAHERTRTVMIQGLAFEIFDDVIRMGASFRIRALRTYMRDRDTGEMTAEYYRGFQILKIFDAEGREIDGTTGEPVRKLVGHERVGHYKRQRCGAGGLDRQIIWVDGYDVNGGRLADDADLETMFRD